MPRTRGGWQSAKMTAPATGTTSAFAARLAATARTAWTRNGALTPFFLASYAECTGFVHVWFARTSTGARRAFPTAPARGRRSACAAKRAKRRHFATTRNGCDEPVSRAVAPAEVFLTFPPPPSAPNTSLSLFMAVRRLQNQVSVRKAVPGHGCLRGPEIVHEVYRGLCVRAQQGLPVPKSVRTVRPKLRFALAEPLQRRLHVFRRPCVLVPENLPAQSAVPRPEMVRRLTPLVFLLPHGPSRCVCVVFLVGRRCHNCRRNCECKNNQACLCARACTASPECRDPKWCVVEAAACARSGRALKLTSLLGAGAPRAKRAANASGSAKTSASAWTPPNAPSARTTALATAARSVCAKRIVSTRSMRKTRGGWPDAKTTAAVQTTCAAAAWHAATSRTAWTPNGAQLSRDCTLSNDLALTLTCLRRCRTCMSNCECKGDKRCLCNKACEASASCHDPKWVRTTPSAGRCGVLARRCGR